ncbi:GNAT family N-acetyltransferase [Pseudomonadales bacterium]|mgnify:FL=1|nr:GNAT family N-acetyltransferase [Pseudomonadales bacterium]
MRTDSQVTIELARDRDALLIAAMSKDLIEFGLAWRWKPSRVLSMIRDPDCVALVARDDNNLVAFALMEYREIHGHLNLLATDPAYRRRGHARQLLQWLLASARVAGLGTVGLEVRSDNDGAQAFYQRLGFRIEERKKGYYGQGIDALSMVLHLIEPGQAARRPQ